MRFSTKYLAPIGIILFIYIIWSIGFERLLNVLKNLNMFYFFIAVILMGVSLIIKIKKWQDIVKTQYNNFSLSESTSIWLIGLFFATVTPGRIGDFVKAFYLKEKISFGKAFSTVLLERIIDLTVLLLLGMFGAILAIFFFTSEFITLISLVFFISSGIVLMYLLTKKDFVKLIAKPLYKHMIPGKYKIKLLSGFEDTFNGIKKIKDNKKMIIYLFFLSFLSWFFVFMSTLFIAKSLSIDIGFIFLVAFIPLSVIVELIPITMSGLGTREATLIFFFSLLEIPASSTVIFSLLIIMSGLVFIIIGLFLWIKRPLKISF